MQTLDAHSVVLYIQLMEPIPKQTCSLEFDSMQAGNR